MNYRTQSESPFTSPWRDELARRQLVGAAGTLNKMQRTQRAPRPQRASAVMLTDEQFLAQSLALVAAKALRRTR